MNKVVFSRKFKDLLFSRTLSSVNGAVGFIGLGNMGGSMALNLIKAGHKIVTYDTDPKRIENVKSLGAGDKLEVASSIADLVSNGRVKTVITVLPSSPQVMSVYKGKSGLLENAAPSTLFLDCTTGDPVVCQEIYSLASNHNQMIYLDCPISGGVNAARDATLTFMVGGSNQHLEMAKPYLDKMGKKIFHCGDIGTGLAAKICNNMLLAISMIGVSEAMNLGIKLGLNPNKLAEVLNSSTGRCWSSDTYNPVPGVLPGVPASNDYKGGFGTALMLKDLGLAQKASLDNKVAIPLGGMALQLYRLMTEHGLGDKDFGVIYKYLSESKN